MTSNLLPSEGLDSAAEAEQSSPRPPQPALPQGRRGDRSPGRADPQPPGLFLLASLPASMFEAGSVRRTANDRDQVRAPSAPRAARGGHLLPSLASQPSEPPKPGPIHAPINQSLFQPGTAK